MKKGLQVERKFLVVAGDKSVQEEFQEAAQKHLAQCHFFFAATGSEAIAKIENAPPHIIVIDDNLTKTKPEELVSWILTKKKTGNIAILWLRAIPEENLFVDEVVTGQVQFIDNFKAKDDSLSKALSRAMNYLAASDGTNHFLLKFLAPGDQLLKQGEVGTSVYLVKRGELNAILNKEGKEVFLGKVSAGEFVGEMAYINGEPRSADVFAEIDCELIEFPADKLDHMLFLKPSWSKALMQTLTKRLKRANEMA